MNYPFPWLRKNCKYIAFLTLSLTSAGSVQAYVLGLKKLYTYAKIPWPLTPWYVDMVLDGVKKVLEHVITRAEPMTPGNLSKIAKLVNRQDPLEVVCFTVILLSFVLFFEELKCCALHYRELFWIKTVTQKGL